MLFISGILIVVRRKF